MRAASGSESLGAQATVSPVTGLTPGTDGMSAGLGRSSPTASRSGWIPLFFRAAPQSTGTSLSSIVARRAAATSWASSIGASAT